MGLLAPMGSLVCCLDVLDVAFEAIGWPNGLLGD